MSFVRQLTTLPRRRPRFAALPALALLWLGWFLWPPQPDFRYQGPPGYMAEVLPNGRQATFFDRQSGDGVLRPYRATVVDIPTGRVTPVSYMATAPNPLVAPSGERAVTKSGDSRSELRSWPAAERISMLPDGDWSIRWSPDGRHLALSRESKLINIRATTGEVVSQLVHGQSAPEFLPDGSGICVLSPDRSRIEVWGLEPVRVVDSYTLPYPPNDKQTTLDDVPIADSCEVRSIRVSRDGRHLFATIVRYPRIAGGLRVVDSIVTWDRLSGKRVTFDMGDHDLLATIHLEVSPDGQTIGTTLWMQLGSSSFPSWQAEPEDIRCSRPSAWQIKNDEAIAVNTPPELDSVVPCGHYLICGNLKQSWILDSRSGQVTANLPQSVGDKFWMPQSDTGYVVVSEGLPEWLPDWLKDLYEWFHPEGVADSWIVRVHDGSVSRQIPRHRRAWFDDDGSLWTTNPTAAGGELIERWTPELARPWWLYALTAAGVGYLIWPTMARLKSRWRQTRPAAIAV